MMRLRELMPKDKKGAGIVTNTVAGIGALLILVVIILVITSTVLNSNLLSENSSENLTAQAMAANFSQGIGNISAKIPTILLIVAVVFLFGALVLLMRQAGQMGIGGGSSL